MNFEKKNNIYKIIMIIIVTALVSSLLTASIIYRNTSGSNNALINSLTKYISKSEGTEKLNSKINIIKSYLEKNYIGELNEEKMIDWAVKGYVAGLGDKYTEYLTQDEYDELMIDVYGNYVGIGIYMTSDLNNDILVLLPIEGSPAEEADIKTGDIITKVNGEECNGKDLSIIANKIKGEEGTNVELEIKRDEEIIIKTITRKKVVINFIKSKVLDNNIGYIQVLSFDEGCSDKFKENVEQLKAKGIKSLIIDIRNNGGGIVDEVIEIAEIILPKDKIIMKTIDKDKNEKTTKTVRDDKIDIDIVLLVNENSASASEILAGALKDNKYATIIGTKTYGKGVMQEVDSLKIGGALKITIEEFKTPNGDTIHEKGIEPDIIIEEIEEQEKDIQLEKAKEVLNK